MKQARQVDAEHKNKYPDYVYSPKEARIQKALRLGSRKRGVSQPGVTERQPRSRKHLVASRMSQSGASSMMRANEETEMQQGGPWAHYTTAARQQEVPSYPLRQQVMNGSYGNCMPTQPVGGTSGSSEASHVDQMINHSDRGVGTANNIQQDEPADNAVLSQNMVIKKGVCNPVQKAEHPGDSYEDDFRMESKHMPQFSESEIESYLDNFMHELENIPQFSETDTESHLDNFMHELENMPLFSDSEIESYLNDFNFDSEEMPEFTEEMFDLDISSE